jgi:hypothetical protein
MAYFLFDSAMAVVCTPVAGSWFRMLDANAGGCRSGLVWTVRTLKGSERGWGAANNAPSVGSKTP